jgi:hypothetical protein
MFRKIKESFKKSWKGEEKLWKVFWIWGVPIYLSAIPIGSITMGIEMTNSNIFAIHLALLVGILGIIFAFIYPIIFCVSLWRCAKNSDKKIYLISARIFIIPFLFIHLFVGLMAAWGGLGMTSSAIRYYNLEHLIK